MTVNTKNLFISHSWAYSDAYDKLTEMLNTAPYFSYKDYSVPKNDPIHNANNDTELYNAIQIQIQKASVVVIMAGVYATYSKWINKEIAIAKSLNKPIVAIEPWASTNTSVIVKQNADKIVGWNTSSIVDAIRDVAV